ncbi:hypothetical protein IAD21_05897 [Abditibacteriota bacterium]|nr:hypothetical protein IAD21_05897 [Abditibacteriota bacterium]
MNKIFVLAVLPCALGVKAVHASALLKPTSGVTQALTPKSLQIESNLRGAFAQTMVTTTYANPNSTRIEADFMYSAPKGSVVTGFAYWYGREKVVARVVEKGRAAKIYQYITSRMRDPALIEMVGPNKFRARIFPIEANADLKIEVRLAQTLGATKEGQSWSWPLREETRDNALQNVSVHLKSDRAFRSNLGSVENNELKFEKTNFRATDDADALVPQNAAPLRASLIAARDGGSDGFFSLALASNSPVALPRFTISGISTYNVLIPTMRRLDANGNFVVMGRYKGSGTALVSLNGRSVQVNFPDARETNNLPSLLWAAGRIESLSSRATNMVQVMALSKRFGVPSRWTSWLAIPDEERKNFRRQMWASDRASAAKAYAQAISRGDGGARRAQKAIFDDLTKKIQADGSNYAENEELQPLSSYLNDELRSLRRAMIEAKYDGKVSKSQSAQWAKWATNLRRAGASGGGKGVDLPVYVIEDELRIASRLYLQEIEAGHQKGRGAQKYQARLKQLAQTKTAREYGWNESTFLYEQAQMRANALAMDIATNRASDHPDIVRQKQAEQRLAQLVSANMGNANSALNNALEQVWGGKIRVVAEQWAGEIAAGRSDSPAAAEYERQVRALQTRAGMQPLNGSTSADEIVLSAASNKMAEIRAKIGIEVADKRENEPQIGTLRTELEQVQQKFPSADSQRWEDSTLGSTSEEFAWEGRAHEAAYRLLEAQKKTPTATTQIDALQRDLDQSVQKGKKDKAEVLDWEKSRVDNNEPLVTASDYRLRSGDPLISVMAPASCREVVALMPDGTLLPLRFNAINKSWEARFDVPTFAPDGDYRVKILIVAPDGARRQLTMNFAVDSHAPRGIGSVNTEGKIWHLSLESDEHTDRVSAFLPWNERIELRRNENAVFVADATVPAAFGDAKAQVRFLLTDGAHNKTEVMVDLNH